jgi:hypothetical protein
VSDQNVRKFKNRTKIESGRVSQQLNILYRDVIVLQCYGKICIVEWADVCDLQVKILIITIIF